MPQGTSEPQLSPFQMARALQAQGQLTQAKAAYEDIVKQDTGHFEALHMLGIVNAQLGHFQSAVDLICRAIEINPQSDSAYYDLGYTMCKLNVFEAGVECYEKALAINPQNAQAACDRASALQELGRFEEALVSFDLAISLVPHYSNAYSFRGNSLLSLGRTEEAIQSFDKAIALNPNDVAAFLNRGNAFQAKEDCAEAVASYTKAIALEPNHAIAYSNRGVSLKYLHQIEASLESSNAAIAIDPEFSDAYWNRALTFLLSGDLAAGFKDYQRRWETAKFKKIHRPFPRPMWLGDTPIKGKKLLIHAEQGFGDTIQFARYAQLVAEAGGHVISETEKLLFDLFKSLKGVGTLIRQGDPLPEFDYSCPVMSLPLAFKTELSTIPAESRYLAADAEKLTHWAGILGPKTKPRIGLVWSGSATHQDDHNRSLKLQALLDALPKGYQFVSLQKEVRDWDVPALKDTSRIQHFGEKLTSFSDTAALCELMDLVISVDTSVAHLSAALGQPTWVLLPFVPDWRWMLNRQDSPWYPTMRLYRQAAQGDWSQVLVDVARDLGARLSLVG